MGCWRTTPLHDPANAGGAGGPRLGEGDGDLLFFGVWRAIGEWWPTGGWPFVFWARRAATRTAAAAMTTIAPISQPARRPIPARARPADRAPARRWSAVAAPWECRDPVVPAARSAGPLLSQPGW